MAESSFRTCLQGRRAPHTHSGLDPAPAFAKAADGQARKPNARPNTGSGPAWVCWREYRDPTNLKVEWNFESECNPLYYSYTFASCLNLYVEFLG
jgi:hypothetical protein